MTELPNFIDIYTYAPDPDYGNGEPVDPIGEFVNGVLVRTNFEGNPSFEWLGQEWYYPSMYTSLSSAWSVTGNTSLYVEPSNGFGARRWHTDPFGF